MANKSNFEYLGNVSVNILIDGKSIRMSNHNLGLPYLFKSFAKWITGNYEGKIDIPQYIDLRKSNDDWVTEKSCLAQQIPLSGRTYEYDSVQTPSNWVARLTAVISYASLIEEIEEGGGYKYRLYLYTGIDDNDPNYVANDIAYLDVSERDLARIAPGIQAIIEWTLQISNATSEE